MRARCISSRSLTLVTVLLLVAAGLLMGCGGKAAEQTPPAEAMPVVSFAQNAVVAEAVVEPARWFELRSDIAGQVAQVLVSEGDRVAAGAPLLSLDTDALALSLQSAEQEVIAQKAALAQLIRGPSRGRRPRR